MLTRVLAATSALLFAAPMAPAAAAPAVPDMTGYTAVTAEGYLRAGSAYFRTPDGLSCAIRPDTYIAGCDGTLPGAPAGANEIVLGLDGTLAGYHQTAATQFGAPAGMTAPVLPVGSKIVVDDYECAVGAAAGPVTVCTKGTPPAQWFVLSASGGGLGPRTAGIPDGFPDPKDYLLTDTSYVVGAGPKNMFPTFTVADGLACSIVMYSGGQLGCDGKLPGVTDGSNEIYAELPGGVGMRKSDNPAYGKPAYPGPVLQLPAGHRISQQGASCMALADGGVACVGTLAGATEGFIVSPSGTSTFGS